MIVIVIVTRLLWRAPKKSRARATTNEEDREMRGFRRVFMAGFFAAVCAILNIENEDFARRPFEKYVFERQMWRG